MSLKLNPKDNRTQPTEVKCDHFIFDDVKISLKKENFPVDQVPQEQRSKLKTHLEGNTPVNGFSVNVELQDDLDNRQHRVSIPIYNVEEYKNFTEVMSSFAEHGLPSLIQMSFNVDVLFEKHPVIVQLMQVLGDNKLGFFNKYLDGLLDFRQFLSGAQITDEIHNLSILMDHAYKKSEKDVNDEDIYSVAHSQELQAEILYCVENIVEKDLPLESFVNRDRFYLLTRAVSPDNNVLEKYLSSSNPYISLIGLNYTYYTAPTQVQKSLIKDKIDVIEQHVQDTMRSKLATLSQKMRIPFEYVECEYPFVYNPKEKSIDMMENGLVYIKVPDCQNNARLENIISTEFKDVPLFHMFTCRPNFIFHKDL